MSPETKALIGYRDDIDLERRWWHRLLKVAGICLFGLVGALAAFIYHDSNVRRPWLTDVEVATNLNDYMVATYEPDRKDYITEFMRLEGEEGIKREARIEPVFLWGAKCIVAHQTAGEGGVPINPPRAFGVCFNNAGDPDDIVKYRLTAMGKARAWTVAAVGGSAWAAGTAFVLLNFYYRVVIYIICGPRRRPNPLQV